MTVLQTLLQMHYYYCIFVIFSVCLCTYVFGFLPFSVCSFVRSAFRCKINYM